MSLTVGTLVAYIEADGSKFNQEVDQSGRRFEGFARVVQTGVQTVARSFAATTTGAVGLGVALYKVGSDYNRLQQNSRAALATMLGGAEAANEQMDKLSEFASTSPFARQVWITAQQQLLGFGVEAKRVIPILDAVQQSVAAVGGGNEQVESITLALAQMQGTGRLTGQTLNQLGIYGIDAATVIGREMGKTGEEIRKLASKPGGIPVDQVWDPLVDGLMKTFPNATEGLRKQMDGAVDRVKAAWRDIGSIIAAPFIDPMGGGRAVDWTNQVADAMRALEQKARPTVDLLVTRFAPGLGAVTTGLDNARSAINGIDLSTINSGLDRLTKYAPLIAPVAAGLFAMGTQGLPILSQLGIAGINPVVAGIAALVASSPPLRQAGREFLQSLSPLLPVLRDVTAAVATGLLGAFEELVPAVGDILQAIAPVIVALGQGLGPAAVAVAQALVPVAGVTADLVGLISQVPTPVLAAVAAFVALRQLDIAPNLSRVGSAWETVSESFRASQGVIEATGGTVGVLNSTLMTARVGAGQLGSALLTALGGPVGVAIGLISIALGAYIAQQQKAAAAAAEHQSRVDDLTGALERSNGAIDDTVRRTAAKQLQDQGALDMARDLSLSLDQVAAAYLGEADAAETVVQQLERLRDANIEKIRYGRHSVTEGYEQKISYNEQGQAADELLGIIRQGNDATRDATQAQKDMADATGLSTYSLEGNTEAVRENIDAQREASGAVLSQKEAVLRSEEQQASFTEAVKRATDAQKAYDAITQDATASDEDKAASLATLEGANRSVESALLTTVRGYDAVLEAMRKNNASGRELRAVVQQQRDAFIENAQAKGIDADAAARLADELGLIPRKVVSDVEVRTADALSTIDRFISEQSRRQIRINTVVNAGGAGPGYHSMQHDGSIMEFYREGGLRGPKLTPMAAVAQMVHPNTWRVVGDRSDVPEAYIPLNHSARSLAILDEAAHRLGRVVMPMHDGGVLTDQRPDTGAMVGLGGDIAIHVYGVDTNNVGEVIRAVRSEMRDVRRGGVYKR